MLYAAPDQRLYGFGLRIALTLLTSFIVVETVAVCETQTVPRVRSHSALLTNAISDGLERSQTFRRLVETIDVTDGLVYVDEGSCRRVVRACLVLSVTRSGPNRILRIFVDPRRVDGCKLIASIGHELQHAVEVLSNPRIRSDGEIYGFFERVGSTGVETFETKEATRAGLDVEREACQRKGEK